MSSALIPVYDAAQLTCSLKIKFHMWMPLLNQTNVCPTNSSSLRIRSLPSLLLPVVSELNNTQFWVNFSRSIKPPTWLWNWPLRYFWNCAAIELHSKVEKILKCNLDSIPSPSPSVKIQIMSGKVCLRCEGRTLLGTVNKLLKTKSLLTSPSNVLPYYLK